MPCPESIIDAVRRWIESIVVGLDLCPFARRVVQGNRIRYVVSAATDAESLRTALADELRLLATAPLDEVETTILIHPDVLESFDDYCDFLPVADQLLRSLRLEGMIQIASFHPQFQFADARPDDVANYTNRSPYPLLHLLREESVSKVAGNEEEMLEIPRRNAELLRKMGREAILARLRNLTEGEGSPS